MDLYQLGENNASQNLIEGKMIHLGIHSLMKY